MMNRGYMNVDQDDESFQEDPGQEFFDDQGGEEYAEEQFGVPQQHHVVVSEAVKRIQQAKLYETLLAHSLFASGSADPEIQDRVESEIKDFILRRLEELLGMRQPQPEQVAQQLPFDDQQIYALQGVANRILRRGPELGSTPTPSINQVQNEPVRQPVQAAQPAAPTVMQVQPSRAAQPQPSPQQAPQRPRQARRPAANRNKVVTGNASKATGKELSQAASRRRKPLPMPSQAVIDQRNAQEAHKNAEGASKVAAQAVQSNQGLEGGVSSAHVGSLISRMLQTQHGGE